MNSQTMNTAQDKTGAAVVVAHHPQFRAYSINVATSTGTHNAQPTVLNGAGLTQAIDIEGTNERIFPHTEVSEEYGGRGLATILVQQALEHAKEQGKTVVALCPLVRSYLEKHGETYTAGGGNFRMGTTEDLQKLQ